jgi:hypothetical protein
MDIVNDLVRCWTAGFVGMPAGAQPGIYVADEPEPTVEQILKSDAYKQARKQQELFAQAYVRQADELERIQKRADINETHRAMADYLGITGRTWQGEVKKENMIQCSWCTKWIPALAIKCPECKEIVNLELYEKKLAGVNTVTEATISRPVLRQKAV